MLQATPTCKVQRFKRRPETAPIANSSGRFEFGSAAVVVSESPRLGARHNPLSAANQVSSGDGVRPSAVMRRILAGNLVSSQLSPTGFFCSGSVGLELRPGMIRRFSHCITHQIVQLHLTAGVDRSLVPAFMSS